MNINCPSPSLVLRLGLLAVLATSVACTHAPSNPQARPGLFLGGGPGGKGVSQAVDFDTNRSAPNWVERTQRERAPMDRAVLPPTIVRR